jgi:AraC-like DNA-binding protein
MRVFHEIRRQNDDSPLGLTAMRTSSITFMAHWHHDIELILAAGGEIPVGIGGKIHRMRKGDLAIVGSGEIHFYEGEPDACDIHIIIFPPHLLGQGRWPVGHRFRTPFFTERPDGDAGCASRVSPEVMTLLRTLFLDIITEVPTRDSAHEDMLKGRVHLFCGTAARMLPTDAATAAGEKRRLEQVVRIQQAMEWLEDNYRSDVTLDELSRQMNTSYHHMSRLFGETVGTPFKQHLNLLRITEADRMLSGSVLSITEIALHCGFNSLRTFNRVYRSIRGQAPSAGR